MKLPKLFIRRKGERIGRCCDCNASLYPVFAIPDVHNLQPGHHEVELECPRCHKRQYPFKYAYVSQEDIIEARKRYEKKR